MRRLIESGAVLGRNFVQVGLRGYWPGPDVLAWMQEQEMKSHFMAEVQAHGFDAELPGKKLAINFSDALRRAVGRERLADFRFGTRQAGGVPVDRTAAGVDHLADRVGPVRERIGVDEQPQLMAHAREREHRARKQVQGHDDEVLDRAEALEILHARRDHDPEADERQ